jgi:hypothetical protein
MEEGKGAPVNKSRQVQGGPGWPARGVRGRPCLVPVRCNYPMYIPLLFGALGIAAGVGLTLPGVSGKRVAKGVVAGIVAKPLPGPLRGPVVDAILREEEERPAQPQASDPLRPMRRKARRRVEQDRGSALQRVKRKPNQPLHLPGPHVVFPRLQPSGCGPGCFSKQCKSSFCEDVGTLSAHGDCSSATLAAVDLRCRHPPQGACRLPTIRRLVSNPVSGLQPSALSKLLPGMYRLTATIEWAPWKIMPSASVVAPRY